MRHYTLTFFPRSVSKDESVRQLYARVRWDGARQSATMSTGLSVSPDGWDERTQCCLPRSKHGPYKLSGQQINAEIVRWQEAVRAVFDRYDAFSVLAPATVTDDLRRALGMHTRSVTVERAYVDFMRVSAAASGWSVATWQKIRTHGRHITEWPPFRSFAGFTPRNMALYLGHLTGELGMSNSSAHRAVGYLRWFLRWCEDQGYVDSQWRAFRPKIKQAELPVVFLTWDELMRVHDWSGHPGTGHDVVRDIFLLQCFTSLRWSDVTALRWADVSEDAIRVTTRKTTEALTIELNKWSREVLDRQPKGAPTDPVFPRVRAQVANRYIKHICRECGIDEPVTIVTLRGAERTDEVHPKWELISSHAGRRTFICNALALGVPPTIVMQWTGHADYRAMKPYIAVADTARRQAMGAFDKV